MSSEQTTKSLALYIDAYKNREVDFTYRKRKYKFALSHGLFSSASVDTGTSFLLKIFSNYLDSLELAENEGVSLLDAGCGTGVLGICAAGALSALIKGRLKVHCQDRDALAQVFTEYNALLNDIGRDILSVSTEALLAVKDPDRRWDIVLSNIPAKAGSAVLEDFVPRSISLLKIEGSCRGKVFVVVVNTLADFFRSQVNMNALLIQEVKGKEHSVFVYTKNEEITHNIKALYMDDSFPLSFPFYIRKRASYNIEKINYFLDSVYGASDFDSPGRDVIIAAKLAVKINLAEKLCSNERIESPILVHDAGQGHFALWLHGYLQAALPMLLAGRNILALSAARAALSAAGRACDFLTITDLSLEKERLSFYSNGFALICLFPDFIPGCRREAEMWEALAFLTAPGAFVIASMKSKDAPDFERKKKLSFVKLGEIKRDGFKALIFQKRLNK